MSKCHIVGNHMSGGIYDSHLSLKCSSRSLVHSAYSKSMPRAATMQDITAAKNCTLPHRFMSKSLESEM